MRTMNRRDFLRVSLAATTGGFAGSGLTAVANAQRSGVVIINPYEGVDWQNVEQHKAALHIHTLQSDGRHAAEEAVRAYRQAGYTIMSLTDHDFMRPNIHVPKEVPEEKASPYPDPRPANFSTNTTWPWTDYGCPSPEELGMIGIESNECNNRSHHINTFYTDCGWDRQTKDWEGEGWEDFVLESVRDKGGMAMLNHPGWRRQIGDYYYRKPLEWYLERFKKHSFSYLKGLEIVNNGITTTEPYDIGLWDQLLAVNMPKRPIWGFGTDDMHHLGLKQAFSVFFLPELTDDAVRQAMAKGQFVACRSSRGINYAPDEFTGFDEFPVINRIQVQPAHGRIGIAASNCDEIRWVSAPETLGQTKDYKSEDDPWETGKVVHVGNILDCRTPGIKNYVRAELHRREGGQTMRVFTNPFGIIVQ